MTNQSIFVPSRAFELTMDRFNHCSSVSQYGDGVIVAWYSGPAECHNAQCVCLLFIANGSNELSEPLILEPKTGNPVIWNEGTDTYLLWSQFDDSGPIARSSDRWKFCSNYVAKVTMKGNKLLLEKKTKLDGKHLLGRCKPIEHNGQYLLPMYDEVKRRGVIFSGKATEFKEIAIIGHEAIQPTLWKQSGRIQSLSRTFFSNELTSPHNWSNNGDSWSDSVPSTIKNKNSSLHAVSWKGDALLIWNDTDGSQRINLRLGIIDLDKGLGVKPVVHIADAGAYPTICVTKDNAVAVSFTKPTGIIGYYEWTEKQIDGLFSRRDPNRSGRTNLPKSSPDIKVCPRVL